MSSGYVGTPNGPLIDESSSFPPGRSMVSDSEIVITAAACDTSVCTSIEGTSRGKMLGWEAVRRLEGDDPGIAPTGLLGIEFGATVRAGGKSA